MSKKQLLILFVCALVPWTVANGLLPLLPVYATRLGADPATVGYYMAFSYVALSIGAVTAGWLSDRLQRRKMPLVIAGLASIPIVWLMGRGGTVQSLTVLTALLWFCCGLALALNGILAGLSAGEKERGRVFGILSLTGGLGALIGGLTAGFIADRRGYAAMFSAMAVFAVLWPLAGMLLTERRAEQRQGQDALTQQRSHLGRSYRFLFSASLVVSITAFVIVLARSLLMSGLGFGALAITSTSAVSGIVAMPLPFLMGWLSDRGNRKMFLVLGYLAGMAALTVLFVSTSLWQFVVALVLWGILSGVNTVVGNAMVTDLLPRESLGRGLALFTATSWIGAVLGSGAGYALQNLGTMPTFILALSLPLIAIALLIPV